MDSNHIDERVADMYHIGEVHGKLVYECTELPTVDLETGKETHSYENDRVLLVSPERAAELRNEV